MPIAGLQGWHLIIILLLVLLLFGAPKLPQLARSLGESMRIFRGEMRTMKDESKTAEGTDVPPATSGTEGSSAVNRDADATTPTDARNDQTNR